MPMGDVFSMFRSGAQNNAPAMNNQPPANQPPANQPPQNPNANVNDPNSQQNSGQPNGQQSNNNPAENRSPLAEFSSLWENTPTKEGETHEPDWGDHSSIVPQIKVDPQKLIQAARRIDFTKAMNPERVKAALGGDVGAFNEVINNVAQAAFANMAMSTTRIVESASRQMAEKLYSGALPHHLKRFAVDRQIEADNPILSDPAVAPMFEMAKQQFQVKYPKASAKEISDMAKRYVTTFAEAVTKSKEPNAQGNSRTTPQGNKTGVGNEDWTDFFGVEQ